MTSLTLLRRLGRAEYALASASFHAVDRAAARYLDAESPVRITFARGLDALDAAAERVLGTAEPTPADTAHDQHQPFSAGAGPDEDSADEPTVDLVSDDRDPDPSPDEPADDAAAQASTPSTEHGDDVDRVAEELMEDLDEAPLAGELAEAPEDEKQRMADLRAKHLVEEFEAEQRARHARFQES